MPALSLKPSRCLTALMSFLIVGAIVLNLSKAATIRAQQPAKKDPPAQSQTSPAPELTPQELIEQLQKKVAQLNSEVARLRAELAKLERYRQIDYTRDLMIKEEDRIRGLQTELNDDAAKETALRKRLDEIEKEQNPDRIQRSMAGVGSTRPEEERAAIMTKLSNEKRNIQSQLDTLRSSRTRITGLIANAETSISRLKQRLSELSH